MSIADRLKLAWRVLAGYHMTEWSTRRTTRVDRSQSARKDIPYAVRRKMLDWSRELERRDPLFNRFLDLNEQYVVGPTGLKLVSASRDSVAAQLMNEAWDGWTPYCDLSSRFSFGTRQGLITREFRVAGEVFIYLTYGNTGRPRIQLVESERCETPPKLSQNPNVIDGVQVDSNGRPEAYWFQEDSDTNRQPTWTAVAADRIVHLMDPSRIGQMRGLPIVYPVLRDLIDVAELQELEMLAAKDAASTSKVVTTADGDLDAEQILRGESTTFSDGHKEYYKQEIGGETIVLRNGDTYSQFPSNRPSVAVQSFWDFVSARAAAGLGLPIEILIMRSLQGTTVRGLYDMAHAYFRCATAVLADPFARIWEHVMLNERSVRNRLPGDFRRIRYTPPRSINVDVGYNSNALINEWRAGFTTLEAIASARGEEWEQIMDQRAIEIQRSRQIEQDYQLPPGSVLELSQPKPSTAIPSTTQA